jgi:hypothetical protein
MDIGQGFHLFRDGNASAQSGPIFSTCSAHPPASGTPHLRPCGGCAPSQGAPAMQTRLALSERVHGSRAMTQVRRTGAVTFGRLVGLERLYPTGVAPGFAFQESCSSPTSLPVGELRTTAMRASASARCITIVPLPTRWPCESRASCRKESSTRPLRNFVRTASNRDGGSPQPPASVP